MKSSKHVPMPFLSPLQIAGFWSKIERRDEDSCWPWKGYREPRYGYGRIAFRKFRPSLMAHRVSYFLYYGVDPLDQCVLHRCDNPPCCNPVHAFLGSDLDNLADMRAKGRGAIPRYPKGSLRGEKARCVKLKEEDIRTIDRLIFEGLTGKQIAEQFNVSKGTIHKIRNRLSWDHVPNRYANMSESRRRETNRPPATPAEIEEIERLTQSGFTLKAIGDALGFHRMSICAIRRKHHILRVSRSVKRKTPHLTN